MNKDELKAEWMKSAEEMFERAYTELVSKAAIPVIHSEFIDIVVPNLNNVAEKVLAESLVVKLWFVHGSSENGRKYLLNNLETNFMVPSIHVTAKEFIEALSDKTSGNISFFQKLNSTKALFIDEIQDLEKSAGAGLILGRNINTIINNGGRVVLSGDRPSNTIFTPENLTSLLKVAKVVELGEDGKDK